MKKIIYIHGLGSSPNSRTADALSTALREKFEFIFPEVTHNVEQSLAEISAIIAKEKPGLVMGTSLGGFYTMCAECKEIKKIIINPSLYPSQDLRAALGINRYQNPRNDRQKQFNLTEDDLKAFRQYEKTKEQLREVYHNNTQTICISSTHDELLKENLPVLKYIFADQLIQTDKIGHRLEPEFIKEELSHIIEEFI